MDELKQKINEQLDSLKYLEGTREKNLQILNKRIREIAEANKKKEESKKTEAR